MAEDSLKTLFTRAEFAEPAWILADSRLEIREITRALSATPGRNPNSYTLFPTKAALLRLCRTILGVDASIAMLNDREATQQIGSLAFSHARKFPALLFSAGFSPDNSASGAIQELRLLLDTLRFYETTEANLRRAVDEFGNEEGSGVNSAELLLFRDMLQTYQRETREVDFAGALEWFAERLEQGERGSLSDHFGIPSRVIVFLPISISPLERRVWQGLARHSTLFFVVDDYVLEAVGKHDGRSIESSPTSKLARESIPILCAKGKSAPPVISHPSFAPQAKHAAQRLCDGAFSEDFIPEDIAHITVKRFRDQREEVRFAVDSIAQGLRSGERPENFQIIATNLDNYFDLLQNALTDQGIPFSIPRGDQLSRDVTAGAFLSYLNWIDRPTLGSARALFTAPGAAPKAETIEDRTRFIDRYRAVLSVDSPRLQTLFKQIDSTVAPSDFALERVLRRLKSWGIFCDELSALAGPLELDPISLLLRCECAKFTQTERTEGVRRENEEQAFLELLSALSILLREVSEADCDRQEVDKCLAEPGGASRAVSILRRGVRRCFRFVKPARAVPQLRGRRAAALGELRRAFREGMELWRFETNPDHFSHRLATILRESIVGRFATPRAPVSGVVVTELLDAPSAREKSVYLLGMTAESFPRFSSAANSLHPFQLLSDRVSARASSPLMEVYQSFYLLGFLLRQTKSLVMSFSTEGKGAGASSIVEEISALRGVDYSPERETTTRREDLSGKEVRGAELLAARFSSRFTPYDGEIGRDFVELQARMNRPLIDSPGVSTYSASELETLLDCPHRFFFQRVLGLRDDDAELEDNMPRLVGTGVHEVLERFFSELAKNQLRVKAEHVSEHSARLHQFGVEYWEKGGFDWKSDLRIWGPVRRMLAGLLGESSGLLQPRSFDGPLRTALLLQLTHPLLVNSTPELFEKRIPRNEALRIAHTNGIAQVIGKLDRIDRADLGAEFPAWQIWDYKNSTSVKPIGPERLKSLQVLLYALWFIESGKRRAEEVAGGLLFLGKSLSRYDKLDSLASGPVLELIALGKKGSANAIVPEKTGENLENGRNTVVRLDTLVREGRFQQISGTSHCERCGFREICARDDDQREMKWGGPADGPGPVISDRFQYFREPEIQAQSIPRTSQNSLSDEQEPGADISRSVAVNAGAGSGKTRVLISRIVRLVLSGVELRSIVAITFSEAAAAQIRHRLERALQQALVAGRFENRALADLDRERLINATFELHLAQISTIHGLCARIIAGAPHLVGLPKSFTVLTDPARQELLDEVVAELIESRGKFGKRVRKPLLALIEAGYAVGKIRTLTRKLLERAVALEDLSRAFALENFSKGAHEEFDPTFLPPSFSENVLSTDSRRELLLGRALVAVAIAGRETYQAKKLQLGSCDFDDQLLFAHHIVTRGTDAKNVGEFLHLTRLRSQFIHFMVDELQDTDRHQWEIVTTLLNDKTSLMKRTVFVVGDPKQGIYSFRGGDIRVFQTALNELEKANGAVVTLQSNFRSDPEVVRFINDTFGKILGLDYSRDGEPRVTTATPPQPMRAAKDSGERASPRVLEVTYPKSRSVYAPVVECVTEFLEGALAEIAAQSPSGRFAAIGTRKERIIAVLCRNGKQLATIAAELRKRGIPFSLEASEGFFELPEIEPFLNLTTFLSDPHDPIALVGILRSVFVGLSDRELFELSLELESKWERIFSNAPSESELLRYAKVWLQRLLDQARYCSPSSLFETIAVQSGVYEAFERLGRSESAKNIEKFIDFVRRGELEQRIYSSGSGANYSELSLYFERLKSSPRECPTANRAEHPIVLMTIHASKGLEFPLVVIPFLDWQGGKDDYITGEIVLGEKMSTILCLNEVHGDDSERDTETRDLVQQSAKLLRAAEERRLFYVACTRAEDYLVLLKPVAKEDAKKPKKKAAAEEVPDLNQAGVDLDLAIASSGSPQAWLEHFARKDN